jgi:glycosyltransferase involved in cell wall biosynthesis
VFGAEKLRVLSHASLYLQTSRWEGFSISIAEAMYLGLPCALSSTMNLADVFTEHQLGLVVSPDPVQAGRSVAAALANRAGLKDWSDRARSYAHRYFEPRSVAQQLTNLYAEVGAR